MAFHTNEFIVTDIRVHSRDTVLRDRKFFTNGGGTELQGHCPYGPSDYCRAVTKGVARCARALPKAERTGNYQYL